MAFLAVKFISCLLSSQQDASGRHYNYLDLACEVKPVCLLCGGCSLCLEHRMCVGVVGRETGWKGMFIESHIIVCVYRLDGQWRACKEFKLENG